ncbi:MAG: protein phosphatase 2C domain-containing protein [Lachnospiraceae bacterium]|nr:protein phosphatase 2C domain-containing protein [Lachnospiraceae bacterium]
MGRRIKGRKGKKEAVKIEKTLDLGCRELYQVDTGGAGGVSIGKLHGIGTREKQQDAFGISDVSHIEEKGLLLVLADGMGGLSGGETASMETVVACLSYFDSMEMAEEPEEYFSHMMEYANEQVKKALGSHHGDGGSTAVAVWLWEHSMFYISVGDSRLLLFREGELTQLNREHNYLTILLEKAMRGEITLDEVYNDPQKDALTSYIGENLVSETDMCQEPLKLRQGDKIILMSDGIYRTVGEGEMKEILKQSPQRAAMKLERMIFQKAKPSQDNYTALIVEIISEEKQG